MQIMKMNTFEKTEGKTNASLNTQYVNLILIAFLFLSLISCTNKSRFLDIEFDKKSYNAVESYEIKSNLEFVFKESCDSIYVEVYDKIKNDNASFIYIELFPKDKKVLSNDDATSKLRKDIVNSFKNKISDKDFIIRGFISDLSDNNWEKGLFGFDSRIEYDETPYTTSSLNDSIKIFRTFYDSGEIESQTTYLHGKLDGIYQEWHKNGKIKVETVYSNGQRNGFSKKWDEYGNLTEEWYYKNNTLKTNN
jgi:antitoxin component YwqK of YwqJK toxin-antitoxin module